MNDFYSFFINNSGLSHINAGLVIIIFLLARQRYLALAEDAHHALKRIQRLEISALKAGMNLVDLEDM